MHPPFGNGKVTALLLCADGRNALIFGRGSGRDIVNMQKCTLFAAVLMLALVVGPRARAQSGTTYQNGNRITCASDDMKRHYCPINTGRGARMVNQRSGSPCIQGSTWGYDRRGIWVDRGCRADFVVDAGGGYPPPGNGYYPPPGNGYYPPPNGGPPATITCSSNDKKYNFCSAYTGRGVRLVNQRSGSPCIQGQTWGYNNKGIWVDRGCRADFMISR